MLTVTVHPAAPALLGVVHARDVDPGARPASLEEALGEALTLRRGALAPDEEAVRQAVRDMLRHGRYKPTGRAKPASEYLLRAVSQGEFPRINAPVDVCNVVSVRTLLPISVWDVEKAATTRYLVRHGMPGESYVFNAGGQEIDLADLLLGAGLQASDGPGTPMVNPVKDSLATKTDDRSSEVAALIYAPAEGDAHGLRAAVDLFASLVGACGPSVRVSAGIVGPGDSLEV